MSLSASPARLRVALCAWEIGRPQSGYGAKIGGLASVVEELPPAMIKAAYAQGIDLEVVTLAPCFGHFDRSKLERVQLDWSVTLEGSTFPVEAYRKVFTERIEFPDGPREVPMEFIFIWDDWMLNWTHPGAIYPHDPWMMAKLAALVGQGMAGYITQTGFDTIHLHDYHVGLVPFYLPDEVRTRVPIHLTVHNATYQGVTPLQGGGYETLYRLGLPGHKLFHEYFDWLDNLNLMKACMLRVHQLGGKITTVSGDLEGTWGYAAELRQTWDDVRWRAGQLKGAPPGDVFVPNCGLDLFEKLPIVGITNGLAERNLPDRMPQLQGDCLQKLQQTRPDRPLFRHPTVQQTMLEQDHRFDAQSLDMKTRLKRLLMLECFGEVPDAEPVVMCAVGRLVPQKNLELILPCIGPILAYDPNVRFIIIATPTDDRDPTAAAFAQVARQFPKHVFYSNEFNQPLSRLMLSGSDFTLIPSRFEPCGLVDYEACVLGTLPVGRLTGGLAKTADCGYYYEWLDISDRNGEARAFAGQMLRAIDVFRHQPDQHAGRIRKAMSRDVRWDSAAKTYVDLFRYGLLVKQWHGRRRQLLEAFHQELGERAPLFQTFFNPGPLPYGDMFDWNLKEELARPPAPKKAPETPAAKKKGRTVGQV